MTWRVRGGDKGHHEICCVVGTFGSLSVQIFWSVSLWRDLTSFFHPLDGSCRLQRVWTALQSGSLGVSCQILPTHLSPRLAWPSPASVLPSEDQEGLAGGRVGIYNCRCSAHPFEVAHWRNS